jgi:ABC-type dipeptide/oligopeptide/nickel transport system permease component
MPDGPAAAEGSWGAGLAGGVVRRAGQALVTLWVASVLVWALLLMAPGDPALAVLAANDITNPNPLQVSAERAKLGLDGSPASRYLHWLAGVLHGQFGTSWATGQPVSYELGIRIGATLVLTAATFGICLVLALAFALVSAWAPGRWPDNAARGATLACLAVPSFLVGTIILDMVVVRWGHFRVIANGQWNTVLLPALTLALGPAAAWARILRAALLDAGGAAYLEVAAARGAGKLRRLLVHALPNSLVSFLTVMAIGVAALLGGAPVVETVFTWPGVGAFFVQSITASDIPVIQGFTLFAISLYIVFSLLVDLVAMWIDPRLVPAGRRTRRAESLMTARQ